MQWWEATRSAKIKTCCVVLLRLVGPREPSSTQPLPQQAEAGQLEFQQCPLFAKCALFLHSWPRLECKSVSLASSLDTRFRWRPKRVWMHSNQEPRQPLRLQQEIQQTSMGQRASEESVLVKFLCASLLWSSPQTYCTRHWLICTQYRQYLTCTTTMGENKNFRFCICVHTCAYLRARLLRLSTGAGHTVS